MFDLSNKKVLITGCSEHGIGTAAALAFHKLGATVAITTRKNTILPGFENIKERFHTYIVKDLSDSEELKTVADKIEKELNGIDILVNNAGITKDNLLLRMSPEDWDMVLNINLKTPFLLSKFFIPKMMKRNWGRVINISSVVGVAGNVGQANYSASKGGLIALTKSLAREFAIKGVTVNAVAPGYIQTAMTEKLPEDIKNKMISTIPLNKMGKPEDIAAAIVFLASEEASYITGETINVNGGMVMV